MATPPRRPPIPGLLGRWLARVYGSIMRARNGRYDAGRGVIRFDRAVISVGNLSVGGTGKTPMVSHVVRTLLDQGRRPCIAMRGYASREGLSDEAEEYRRAFPDVDVILGANRSEGLLVYFATPESEGVEVVVLDDGFQHRRVARDLDLVLIDATRNVFEDALLPAGYLREPPESLDRAHAVILTHTERVSAEQVRQLRRSVEARNPDIPIAECRHEWTGLLDADGNALPLDWLKRKRVCVACAIGNPDAFLAQAREHLGVNPVSQLVLPDHDPFTPRTIRRLLDQARYADAILVTDKDWSKLTRVKPEAWPCPVVRPVLTLAFAAGREAIDALIAGVHPGE